MKRVYEEWSYLVSCWWGYPQEDACLHLKYRGHINKMNIDIDFVDDTCYKLLNKTRAVGRRLANRRLSTTGCK